MAKRNVVIFVSFSLFVGVGVPLLMDKGTHLRKFSNALLISRMRVRSRAFAVFRRYLLSGAAFDFVRCFAAAVVDLRESLLPDGTPVVATGVCRAAVSFAVIGPCNAEFFVREHCRLWRCRSEYFSLFLLVLLFVSVSDSGCGNLSNAEKGCFLSLLECIVMAMYLQKKILVIDFRSILRITNS